MRKLEVNWDNVRIIAGILFMLIIGFCVDGSVQDKLQSRQHMSCVDHVTIADSLLNESIRLDSAELKGVIAFTAKHHNKLDSLSNHRQRYLIRQLEIRQELKMELNQVCGD